MPWLRLGFIVCLAICGSAAMACKCAPQPFETQANEADMIFAGQVSYREVIGNRTFVKFKLSAIYKGNAANAITITTGLGGGDCGYNFETGKSYLVFSKALRTNSCMRNSILDQSPDISKVKYTFEKLYRNNIGNENKPLLNIDEAYYLNSSLIDQRGVHNFVNLRVAFFNNESKIDKVNYFKSYGGKDINNVFLVLTKEERLKTKYDALVIITDQPSEAINRPKLIAALVKKKKQSRS